MDFHTQDDKSRSNVLQLGALAMDTLVKLPNNHQASKDLNSNEMKTVKEDCERNYSILYKNDLDFMVSSWDEIGKIRKDIRQNERLEKFYNFSHASQVYVLNLFLEEFVDIPDPPKDKIDEKFLRQRKMFENIKNKALYRPLKENSLTKEEEELLIHHLVAILHFIRVSAKDTNNIKLGPENTD
jgi:hypothetical protein